METQPLLGSRDPQSPSPEWSDGQDYVVDFDPEGDAEDPRQWPKRYRWEIVLLLALMAFTVTFTCVGIVPVAPLIIHDLAPDDPDPKTSATLFVTIWELGEAAGPLLIAPLSELYGRAPAFNVCNALFILGVSLTALCANSSMLIFARFLTGCAVASNVLNPACIADLFPSHERGVAMSAVMLTPLIGGAVGPAIAGAIAEKVGWRWIMGVSVVLAVVCEGLFLVLLRETYPVVVLRRKAERVRAETGDERWVSVHEVRKSDGKGGLGAAILRPLAVLFGSPVLLALSVWAGMVFTFFYIMSTTLPDILHDVYSFSPAMTGSAFLAFSVGSSVGLIVCNALVDRIYIRLSARQAPRNDPDDRPISPTTKPAHLPPSNPEARLPLAFLGALFMPPLVLLYGLAPNVSALLTAVALQGFALILCELPAMTYVTDAFGLYSASAMTGVLITRCLMGTFLPLATAPLIRGLGVTGCWTVLAGVVGGLAVVPGVLMVWGGRLRGWGKYGGE